MALSELSSHPVALSFLRHAAKYSRTLQLETKTERAFSLIRDGRVASQKSDRLDVGHGSQNGYFAPKKSPVWSPENGPNGASLEAWKCPKPRDQLDHHERGEESQPQSRTDRGHAENRILKRSIIQFCDVFLFRAADRDRQCLFWMTIESKLFLLQFLASKTRQNLEEVRRISNRQIFRGHGRRR